MSATSARRPLLALAARPGALPLGLIFAALLAMAGLLVAVFGLDRLPFTICYFKLFTGWPCPSCGTTRALGRLVHGDLAGALAMNPLAAVGMLGLGPWALADALLLRRGRAVVLTVGPRLRLALVVLAVLAAAGNWAYLVAAGR